MVVKMWLSLLYNRPLNIIAAFQYGDRLSITCFLKTPNSNLLCPNYQTLVQSIAKVIYEQGVLNSFSDFIDYVHIRTKNFKSFK
jgi:hypothetical protein